LTEAATILSVLSNDRDLRFQPNADGAPVINKGAPDTWTL
jgi:hypothetical protein